MKILKIIPLNTNQYNTTKFLNECQNKIWLLIKNKNNNLWIMN